MKVKKAEVTNKQAEKALKRALTILAKEIDKPDTIFNSVNVGLEVIDMIRMCKNCEHPMYMARILRELARLV